MKRYWPKDLLVRIKESHEDLNKKKKFVEVVKELIANEKLANMGISYDANFNMYVGVEINPELLLYLDAAQEIVEKNFVKEKMRRYMDFFAKEGIIDYLKSDSEIVRTSDHYGCIVQFSFNFTKFTKMGYWTDIACLVGYVAAIVSSIVLGIHLI